MDSTVMHINDFPRPNSTLTRPLCILMIFLDLTRHSLDSNPDNSAEHRLLVSLGISNEQQRCLVELKCSVKFPCGTVFESLSGQHLRAIVMK